jgi:lactate dehydrogenase-like 2-hydroxyacid dehydrogenase
MAIDLLQTQKLPEACEVALRERYTVHSVVGGENLNAVLTSTGERIRAVAGGAVSAELMGRLPALEIIANFGVGYDSVDVGAARVRNIRVTNTPNVLNDAVAELTVGLMLALGRRIVATDRFVREGRWSAGSYRLTSELNGRTVGIIGLGRIGKEIARRLEAMKMRVIYHGRHRRTDEPYVFYDDLTQMAQEADWLVAIAPGGQATQGIVSRRVLEALGPEGCFVNVSRGSLVDQAALVELLGSGALGGAALDVFAEEPNVPEGLLGLDNVVLSPHQGSATEQTRRKMWELMIENLDAHFRGDPLPSAVA